MNGLFPPAWEESGYSDVIQAALDGNNLRIEFRNGDVVLLPTRRLGLSEVSKAEAMEDGLGVRVTIGDRQSDLSWTQIRAASDQAFAQEMRRRDSEEARRIGLRLKALREDLGISQRALAEQVAMPAAQLAKIESGTYDLRMSTVSSLLRAMGASMADIAGRDVPEISGREVAKRFEQAGVSRDVVDRILAAGRPGFVTRLALAFGWDPIALLKGQVTSQPLAFAVQFKAGDAEAAANSPLLGLARRVCEWIITVSDTEPTGAISSNAQDVRAAALKSSQQLTLASLSEWAWEAGIPVVPIAARGAFAAASWRVNQKPTIVLKDSRPSAAFWLFDLAHELGHIARGHVRDRGVVDIGFPALDSSDAQEQAANEFALDLLLPDHRELLAAIRTDARGDFMRFKFAVQRVAHRARVSEGVLGMVAAYELKEIGQYKDRWGSATNLARPEGVGHRIVADILRVHVDLERLEGDERKIVDALVIVS